MPEIMFVCEQCGNAESIDINALNSSGFMLRCSHCKTEFYYKPMRIDDKFQKDLHRIIGEAQNGIAQIGLSMSDMGKIDMGGSRNIGLDRLKSAINMFDWCSQTLKKVILKHAEIQPGGE